MLASIQAHAAQALCIFQQPIGGIAKRSLIPGHRQHAVVAMADMLGCGRLVVGHHPQSRGHRLQHHVAEGFSQAGEQEHIA